MTHRLPPLSLALLATAWLAACTSTPAPVAPAVAQADVATGYRAADAIPDSLALVPAPPAAGSGGLRFGRWWLAAQGCGG